MKSIGPITRSKSNQKASYISSSRQPSTAGPSRRGEQTSRSPEESRASSVATSSTDSYGNPVGHVDVPDEDLGPSPNQLVKPVSQEPQVPSSIPNSTLLEHIATSRFFLHYISPTRTFHRLDLDYTSAIIDHAVQRNILAEAIISLGILTLPRKTSSSMLAARCRYSRALRMTNKALADPDQAKSDDVFMAVILLGLFETTPDDSHSLNSWTAHLDGARMLLRLRGRQGLHAGPTFRMFNFFRQQVLTNCSMTTQPVPEDLLNLSAEIAQTQTGEDRVSSQLIGLYARMCNVLAASKAPAPEESGSLVAAAMALDDDLVTWTEFLPPGYKWSSEPAALSAKAYADYCDVYESLYSAEVWNLYRFARLGTNGIIVEQYVKLGQEQSQHGSVGIVSTQSDDPFDIGPEIGNRLKILESLREGVCASIPFMLDRHGPHARQMSDLALNSRTPVMQMLLFTVNGAGVIESMRSWAMGLVAELQSDEEVERGAIWMNRSHTWKTT